MAEAVAEKKQVRDDEFDIHGDLAVNEADDKSFVVLYDSSKEGQLKTNTAPEPESPTLDDLNVSDAMAAPASHPEDAYIDDILSSDDIEPVSPAAPVRPVAAEHDDEDGPIALTNEELDGILEMGPATEEEFHPDFPVATDDTEMTPPPMPEAESEVPESEPAAFEDEELPIAISDEDLDEILLEEESDMPLPPPAAPRSAEPVLAAAPAATDELLTDEEPIALSDDELDHILADAEAGLSERGPELTPHDADEILTLDEEPEITLIDDDTSALGMDAPLPDTDSHEAAQGTGTSFFDTDEDEPITLSDEELDGILSTAPEEEPALTEEVQLAEASQQESLAVEDEEPIALSHEELDGILMDAHEETDAAGEEPPLAELPPEDMDVAGGASPRMDGSAPEDMDVTGGAIDITADDGASADTKSFFDSDEDEPIALSADELDGIAATAVEEEAPAANIDERYADVDEMETQAAAGADEIAATHDDEDEGPIALSADELDGIAADAHEVTPEAPMVPLSPLDGSAAEPSLAESSDKPATVFEEDLDAATLIHEDDKVTPAAAPQPDTDELKSVMGYLDNLLGELPDDVIEKFAQSEYFKLYQKIMDKLGL